MIKSEVLSLKTNIWKVRDPIYPKKGEGEIKAFDSKANSIKDLF